MGDVLCEAVSMCVCLKWEVFKKYPDWRNLGAGGQATNWVIQC